MKTFKMVKILQLAVKVVTVSRLTEVTLADVVWPIPEKLSIAFSLTFANDLINCTYITRGK